MEFDLAIVGAGIEGSSTAYVAVKSGYKVLLLEQVNILYGIFCTALKDCARIVFKRRHTVCTSYRHTDFTVGESLTAV